MRLVIDFPRVVDMVAERWPTNTLSPMVSLSERDTSSSAPSRTRTGALPATVEQPAEDVAEHAPDTAACARSWEQTSGENPDYDHHGDEGESIGEDFGDVE